MIYAKLNLSYFDMQFIYSQYNISTVPAHVAVRHALGVRGSQKQPASSVRRREMRGREGGRKGGLLGSPADTELVDCLCLVDITPGLTPGLECWKAREQDSPSVYLELTVVTPGPEHHVSEGLTRPHVS